MLSKQLLEMLVCPETRQPVAPAPPELIAKLNAQIAAGKLRTQAGQPVEGRLSAGLLRQDGTVLYPIVDDIPIMLASEAITIEPAWTKHAAG